jgi:hypothetical protein
MRGKIPITEEQFFDSVDSWIWELTGEGSHYRCGFCKAKDEANKGGLVHYTGCSKCLAFELCFPSGSPYYKSRFSDSEEDYKQAVMEVLEGLYEIGVKLGFYNDEKFEEWLNKSGEFYLKSNEVDEEKRTAEADKKANEYMKKKYGN